MDGIEIAGSIYDAAIVATAPQHADKLWPPLAITFDYEPIATVYLEFSPKTALAFPLQKQSGKYGQWVVDRNNGLLACVLSGHGDWEALADDQLAAALCAELSLPEPPRWHQVIREKRATFSCRPSLARPDWRTADSRVVLAGDSLGGYTALAAAAAVPAGQLRGLVLAGCTANMTGSALRQLVRRQWLIGGLAALLGEQRLSRLVAKDLKRAGLSEADVAAQVEAGFNHRVFPQAVAALRGVDFRPRLAAITQPVLIVNGGKDRLFVDQEASFVAVARRATVHRFDGCEHGVSLRRPEAFARLVDGFMAGLGEA